MYERLPEELKRSALCCLWKYEERQGKMTKVPYQLNGNRARTTDRKSFSNFRMIASRAQDYSGIGMGVFDGFCAVDIDGCVANEQLTTMADAVLQRANHHHPL